MPARSSFLLMLAEGHLTRGQFAAMLTADRDAV